MAEEFISFNEKSDESYSDSSNDQTFGLKENAQWAKNKTYNNPKLVLRLHEELIDFYNFMRATKEEHQTRLRVVELISKVSCEIWPNSKTYPYGSFTTDLYLPSSDVDIVIINVGSNPVNVLAKKLAEKNIVSDIETISSARIPIIKCTERETQTKIDICFEVTTGLETARLVKRYLARWPAMRPLILFLKYFLQRRCLNDTYQGGVGSFMLQLMVVSMIQLHPIKIAQKWVGEGEGVTLGAWLICFFELYGLNFNYMRVGISVKDGGSFYRKTERNRYNEGRPYLLSIENPLDPKIDVGKNSFAIMRVKKAFEYAYYQLILLDNDNKTSLLSRIVGVKDEKLENRHVKISDNK